MSAPAREIDQLRAELAAMNASLRESRERIAQVAARPSRPPARKVQHVRRHAPPPCPDCESRPCHCGPA